MAAEPHATPPPHPEPSAFRRAANRLTGLLIDAGLGALVGVLAGLSSAGFLATLTWVTDIREDHGWIVWLLPLAGLGIGLVYHYFAGDAVEGNNLILEEIHEEPGLPGSGVVGWIPRRMAPLVYAGTIVTHLFGGSAGREGTALQMAASLTDLMNRILGIDGARRHRLLVAALGGGFGAVFGVPLAGAVFGLEVQAAGRIRYDAIVPTVVASVVGDLIVRRFIHHEALPQLGPVAIDAGLLARVALAAVLFGLTGIAFSQLTHRIQHTLARVVRWPPLHPALGGIGVLALMIAVGNRDYLGLSLPLIADALDPAVGVVTFAFALKLVFTAVTLGSGFPGGEVTPLFVVGATLGATLGTALGAPVQLMAALGFVAVFAGAANVPLAGTIMGAELFGADTTLLFAITCALAYGCSSRHSIYRAQRHWTERRNPRPRNPPGPDGRAGGVTTG